MGAAFTCGRRPPHPLEADVLDWVRNDLTVDQTLNQIKDAPVSNKIENGGTDMHLRHFDDPDMRQPVIAGLIPVEAAAKRDVQLLPGPCSRRRGPGQPVPPAFIEPI